MKQLPKVKVGDMVKCPNCNKEHVFEPADDGSTLLMFYRCGAKIYLGAVDGRDITREQSDLSGNMVSK